MEIQETLKDLRAQLKNTETMYYKILGAIETLEEMKKQSKKKKTK
tara:strand:- start:30 stop:164 length:135 start_codon:yes stop_codon:yes gene_type:complete